MKAGASSASRAPHEAPPGAAPAQSAPRPGQRRTRSSGTALPQEERRAAREGAATQSCRPPPFGEGGGREKEGGERSRWGDVTPGWGRGENCGMENFQPRASCACSATPRPLLPRLTASHPTPSSFLPPHPVRSSGRGALERSVLLTVVPPQPAQHLGQRGDALPGGRAPARQRAGVAGAPVGSKVMGPGGAVWRGEAPLEESLAAPSWAALPAVPRTGGEAPSRADTT